MAPMASDVWLGESGPIDSADALGLVVIMPRAVQPVTFDEVVAATPDYYPDVTAESKPEDHGRLGDQVVVLINGLPDAEMVNERRAYYTSKAKQFSVAGGISGA